MRKAIGWLILIVVIVGASVGAIMSAGIVEFLKFLGFVAGVILISLIINFAINLITE